MKITKRQLNRIIKEEKQKLLREVTPSERDEASRLSRVDRRSRAAFSGREYGDDNLKSTARLRKALEAGELDWLDDFKSSAVMSHLENMGSRGI